MADILPSGRLSLLLDAGERLVSTCSDFYAWSGATPDTVRDYIGLTQIPRNDEKNFCIVDFGSIGTDREKVTPTSKWTTRPGSNMVLYFRSYVPVGTSDRDAVYGISNFMGAMWEHIELKAGVQEHKNLPVITIDSDTDGCPLRIAKNMRKTAGDYFEASLSLTVNRLP